MSKISAMGGKIVTSLSSLLLRGKNQSCKMSPIPCHCAAEKLTMSPFLCLGGNASCAKYPVSRTVKKTRERNSRTEPGCQ